MVLIGATGAAVFTTLQWIHPNILQGAMTNKKHLLAIALPALALLALMPALPAFADKGDGATVEKFDTGTMTGFASNNDPASASLSGKPVTNHDGTQNLSPLSGTITVGSQTGKLEFKPIGAVNTSIFPTGSCGTRTVAFQIGTVTTSGDGPAVKGIASLEWSTTTSCGDSESATFFTEGRTGDLLNIAVYAAQSPLS